MNEVMIEASELTKRYGAVQALSNVSLKVHRGEIVGFLGPNGAGKTTTMKILTCFAAPTSGTAKVAGCDIFDDSLGVRSSIGYLPESTPLYREMLVLEYLQFIAELRQVSEPRKRIKAAVEEVGLGEMFTREIRTLSKGYRQRVGLAQALLHEPPILILDEPMSGLDPNQAMEIRDLIREIGRERTVILSTHHLAEVQATCDRVLIISGGRIVADDTAVGLTERAGKSRCVVSVLRNGKDAETLRAIFARVPGADRVRLLPDSGEQECFIELLPSGQEDLRPLVFQAAVGSGLTLVELRREGQNLEQIFRDLTTSATAAATATGSQEPS